MIVEQLEALEATNSRKEKEAILEGSTALLRVLLIAALDPYKPYYIQDVRLPSTPRTTFAFNDDEMSWFVFLNFLERLNTREITGNAAKHYLNEILGDMPSEMRKWAARIVQKKLRCGVEAKTVNKVFPDMVPVFEVMLANELDCARDLEGNITIREKINFPVWCDRKLDGIRLVAIREGDSVKMVTRGGQTVDTLPTIEEGVRSLPKGDYVLDGEVMKNNWNETQSLVFSKVNTVSDAQAVYHIFDKIPLEVWKSQGKSLSYAERRNEIEQPPWCVFNVVPVPGGYVHDNEQLLEQFAHFVNMGFEGAMIKDPNAPYEFKRSNAILKVKPKSTWEGQVVGHEFGKGRLSGVFAAFKVRIGDVVTSVGGGFTDQQRKDITADLEDNPKCYWGAIAEVEAQEMTDDGKLRFPVFKRFRNPADK